MKMSQMSLLASAMNNPLQFSSNGNLGFSNFPSFKEGVSYTKRVPNCQKCGQHGRKSRLKGHKRVCPFKDCNCPKCQVVSERQKLMADQIKIRRRQRKDTIMNFTRDKITATLNAAAAVAAAGPLPYLNNLGLLYNQLNQNDATQTTSPTATTAPVGLPIPTATSTAAMNIPTSLSQSLSDSSCPTSLQPSAFMSTSAPTSSYLPSSSSSTAADFLKAAAAITSSSVPDTTQNNNNNIATSPLQLSQFLFGTSPTAALAALTVAGSPSAAALPIPSSTPYDRRSESGSDTSSIASLSSSPTPSSSTPPLFDSLRRRTSSFGVPLSANPFANFTSTFPTSQQPAAAANLPTHEQLLAFLANVQLSSCFPGLNLSGANEPEGSVTGMDTTPQQLPPNNKPTPAALSNNFVDICSV
jgi:hypothetical protein